MRFSPLRFVNSSGLCQIQDLISFSIENLVSLGAEAIFYGVAL